MQNYLNVLKTLVELADSPSRPNRTGINTVGVHGVQLRWNMADGFPILTTKNCHMRSIVHELLWFLRGDTNIQYLKDNGVRIWDEWAVANDVTTQQDKSVSELKSEYANLHGCSLNSVDVSLQGELDNLIAYRNEKDVPLSYAVANYLHLEPTRIVTLARAGDVGPMYGHLWVNWPNPDGTTTNQLQQCIDMLLTNPYSRRIMVSAWHPSYLPDESVSPQQNVLNGKQALACCHTGFKFYVTPGTADDPQARLSLKYSMRSNDWFLGQPFNTASYALLLHMVANAVGMVPHELIFDGDDVHLYMNHLEQAREQLTRTPTALPKLKLNVPVGTSVFDIRYEDIELIGYDPMPAIKATVAV